jgi:RNA polymerase sigma factor (sigma-70 family)
LTGVHAEIVQAAIRGDVGALTEALTLTRRALWSYVQRRIPARLRSFIDADDIVQATHAAAFRGIHDFEMLRPRAFERWLWTIALRELRTVLRDQRAVKRGGLRRQVRPIPTMSALDTSVVTLLEYMRVTTETPSRVMAGRERVAALQAALDQMTLEQREAVRLVYLEGMSAEEAGRRMDKSERAVYNLCDRAKVRLETLLRVRSGSSTGRLDSRRDGRR